MAQINNVAYSWSMIQLMISGSNHGMGTDSGDSPILVDATSIKWNTERKVEAIYGLGGQPRKRGFGNVTYEASITLPYGTQMALRERSEDGTLMGLGEFDLIISWANDMMQNIVSETVTLAGCFFSESGMDANQDDTSISKEFNLHPHRIFTGKISGNSGTKTWTHEMYSGS